MLIVFIVIALISGTIAGMGIGGGSIFILLTTIFEMLQQKEAQFYNLVMFITVGVVSTIYNIRKKNLDIKMLFKLLLPVCFGSIVGIILLKLIDEKLSKIFFDIFMMLIGTYEIISSLRKIFIAKNNNIRKE